MSKECIWCYKKADYHYVGMPREGDKNFIEWYSCHKCMPTFHRNTNTPQDLWYSSMGGWVSHTVTICDDPQCKRFKD
jgi:hypothetical protein